MNFICALSNEIANQPVVSPVSGNVFEKRLILKYLQENENRDPINGRTLNEDQLIQINLSIFEDDQTNGRKLCSKNEFSVAELVRFLQEQWDAMILEIFNLRKQLNASEKEKEIFNLRKQLNASEKEKERLLNQQNESSKYINMLNNELIKYKQREKERKYADQLNKHNIYSNLPAIEPNKENLDFASSINSSTGSSLMGDRFQLTSSHFKSNSMNRSSAHSGNYSSTNSKFSDPAGNLLSELTTGNFRHSMNKFDDLPSPEFSVTSPKFTDLTNSSNKLNQLSSPFSKYNKQLPYSTEYVNLNSNKLIGRNHRPQSVIIQNDSLFEAELNGTKSLDDNLNYHFNQPNGCLGHQKLFKPFAEQITPSSSGSLRGSYTNNLANNLTNKRIANDELYCNLMEMKEFDQISIASRRPTNYENILMFDEDYNMRRSQQSINKFESSKPDRAHPGKIENRTDQKPVGKPVEHMNELKTKLSRAETWSKDFNNLLDDKLGIKIFTSFLIQERSDENIKFWESCKIYASRFKSLSKEEQKKEAKSIVNEFFKSVNLEESVKTAVQKNLNRPTEHLFKEAQTKIYVLMRDDSYRRFLESETYKKAFECDKNSNLLPTEVFRLDLPKTNKKPRRKSFHLGFGKKNHFK